jgi:rhamnogalacturonan endolyase
MSRCIYALIALVILFFSNIAQAERQQEKLSRGLVAVKQGDGVFLSWRLLGTDLQGTAFNVYRQVGDGQPERVNPDPITGASNLMDKFAPTDESLTYFVRTINGSEEGEPSTKSKVWAQNYLDIPIVPIDGYRPGDVSVADLDGDGELEIVLHQTKNARDNSHTGITGTPILDAYKLDGTHMWRIDLGKNIRDGEHYTQFMVYDLDGDGRAEVACKTADGTVDGAGKVIGDADKDYRIKDEDSRSFGRILEGPEFLTIFDGQTGAELKTVDYIPSRDPIDGWGGIGGNAENDNYGNRCDRFLACVAYLDGERPSVIMCRGVYGRIVMAAWDWRDGELKSRWVFDTGSSYPPYDDASPFAGMGGHALTVADVDDDGKDEIVYQAMVVDDNGKGLYSSGLRHGDSVHVSDMYPNRPGLEVFTVQENEENAEKFNTPGAAMRDARTGEILWSHSPTVDIGGGMAADIDPTNPGYEAWGGPGGIRNAKGEDIGPAPRETGWCVWWDGDLLRELLSPGRPTWMNFGGGQGRRGGGPRRQLPQRPGGAVESNQTADVPRRERGRRNRPPRGTVIGKWNWETDKTDTLATLDGGSAGRGPCLVGDILGDWREEVLLVGPEGKSLRLFTTTIPTEHRLKSLLADPQYRLGLVWQNVVYNKPAHPSFFLGDGMKEQEN